MQAVVPGGCQAHHSRSRLAAPEAPKNLPALVATSARSTNARDKAQGAERASSWNTRASRMRTRSHILA
ncbi:hypothetical protein MTO96_036425, partial [Rhipicephalus appendiculatus]